MLNLKLRTLEGTWPRTSVGICARMAWVSIGRLLVAIQGTPARKGGVSLGGEVDGHDVRPGKEKQPARRTAPQPRRSRLPGHACRQRQRTCDQRAADAGQRREGISTAPPPTSPKKTSPAWRLVRWCQSS